MATGTLAIVSGGRAAAERARGAGRASSPRSRDDGGRSDGAARALASARHAPSGAARRALLSPARRAVRRTLIAGVLVAGCAAPAPAPPAERLDAHADLRVRTHEHQFSVDLAGTESLRVDARWYSGMRHVAVGFRERDSVADEWIEQWVGCSTSFDVADLGSAGSHALLVAGRTHRGGDVLELWRFDAPPGARVVPAPAAAETVPQPPLVPVAQRRFALHQPARDVVFEGDLPGVVLSVAAEPGLRFAYLVLGDPDGRDRAPTSLVAVDLRTREARTLASSTTEPLLRGGFESMAVLERAGRGLALSLLFLDARLVLLWDPDGDGLFDEPESYGYDQLMRDGKGVWRDVCG